MILTGAFFAEYARSAEGKLDVLGGIWDWTAVPSMDHSVPGFLIVLMQAGPDDAGRDYTVSVAVRENLIDEPIARFGGLFPPAGGEQRAACIAFDITFANPGRHTFRIDINGGEEYSLPLDVRLVQP